MDTQRLILSNGTELSFEIEPGSAGPEHVSIGAIDDAKKKFREVVSGIAPMTDELIDAIKGAARKPESIEIQMGIKVSGELGAVIAKASTEGNFLVTIKWAE